MRDDNKTPGICGACDKPQYRHKSRALAYWVGGKYRYEAGYAVGDRAKYANTKLCDNHTQMLEGIPQIDRMIRDIEFKQNGTIRIGSEQTVLINTT